MHVEDLEKEGNNVQVSTRRSDVRRMAPGGRCRKAPSAARRAGTPDEVGTVGALLMGPDSGFITSSDFLMDGGVTAAYWYGELAPK
jgi:NAD(P)-dependent dehydrogenase (short-subunit alcohol dehydrogenase family)